MNITKYEISEFIEECYLEHQRLIEDQKNYIKRFFKLPKETQEELFYSYLHMNSIIEWSKRFNRLCLKYWLKKYEKF